MNNNQKNLCDLRYLCEILKSAFRVKMRFNKINYPTAGGWKVELEKETGFLFW